MTKFPCVLRQFLLLSGLLFLVQSATAQVIGDSLDTPFRKGRWLTGLSGSISSNTNKTGISEEKTITNEFGLNFSTGRFIKDRWLLGGKINTDRASSAGSVDRATESLFIGPFVSHYLSTNERGSLFTTLSTGYVRYREETQLNTLQASTELSSEGGGFGTLVGLGYSYVIHDKIAFDIGFNLNLFWIGVDQEELPSGMISSQNIAISNIAFTFGFNVILDDFFF
ncbi:hypothetical protein FGM00_11060 [Aggregatimonas sangjinii]|uniref:Outer membrane protein beta-barrel domain-containing protein n=1 Tax=Aggregatimonas sangjinii TaxID=2583587 RepID=A0A5B7SPL6_9FLAO|nr:hypothetical protein [Aggregatimonas sangjinii]QCX00615.1 hypothetical protein FGM00_11060 [Aggregatimonas sangjinii]